MNFFIPFLNWFSTNKYRNINHIVDPSPWPLLMSFAICQLLLSSLLHYFETTKSWVIIFSFVQLLIFLSLALALKVGRRILSAIVPLIFFFLLVFDLEVIYPHVRRPFPSAPWDHAYMYSVRRLYGPEIYNRIIDIYNSSDRYFLYWYITYHDLLFHLEPWTENTIRRASFVIKATKVIEIVDAAKHNYPEYSPFWQPPPTYLIDPDYHEWLEVVKVSSDLFYRPRKWPFQPREPD